MSEARLEFDENFRKIVFVGNRRVMSNYRNDIIDELTARGKIGQMSAKERSDYQASVAFAIFMLLSGGFIIGFCVFRIIDVDVVKGYNFEEWACVIGSVLIAWFIVQYLLMTFGGRLLSKFKQKSKNAKTEKSAQALSLQHESTELLFEKKRILEEKLGL